MGVAKNNKTKEVSGAHSLFDFIQAEIQNYKKSIQKVDKVDVKIELLKKSLANIQKYRTQKSYQSPEQEIYADLFIESVQTLPLDSSFDVKKCDEYKKRVKDQFKMSGPGEKLSASSDFEQIWIWLCSK